MFTGFFVALKALSIWSRLAAFFDAVAQWAAKNPVAAALAISLACNGWWVLHTGPAYKKQIATLTANYHDEQVAYGALQAAYAVLQKSVDAQNASIKNLSATSAAQQAAAQATINGMAGAVAAAHDEATALRAGAGAPPAAPCQTHPRTLHDMEQH